jgi:hypothetical protein
MAVFRLPRNREKEIAIPEKKIEQEKQTNKLHNLKPIGLKENRNQTEWK